MLTELAKREPERVAIDVDDQGIVWYRVARPFSEAASEEGRRRVGESAEGPDGLAAEDADLADRQVRR